ncbi:MAG: hypothetical protein Fur0010_25570 [Bdellovibrio sp.]
MKSKLVAFFLLSLITVSSGFSMEVEFDSLQCNKSMEKDLSCNDRDGIGVLLDMSTIVFRSVSFICGLAPEPAVTKATALVSNGLSIMTAFTSFMVKNMPCRQSGTYKPVGNEETDFIKAVCRSLQKDYDPVTKACIN